MRRWSSVVVVLAAPALCATTACATAPAAPAAAPSPASDEPEGPLPAPARQYTTTALPDGVSGGPRAEQLAREVRAALRARGDDAVADGALAPVAMWLCAQTRSHEGAEQVALRAGFPGAISTAAAFRLDSGADDVWRNALADVAHNMTVSRYAVHVSPDDVAVVVFARMDVSLDPFPRRLQPGEAVRLRGEVSNRYETASVFLTRPDGSVDKTRMSGRAIDASLTLRAPGVYRVEVLSDGATGPVVLANVPVYVGVDEPRGVSASAAGEAPPMGPQDAEARMLVLLNEVRRAANLAPVAADSELQAVAEAHTVDMISSGFFGHVSPTTGTVGDRLQRAGVAVSMCGENLAQASNADEAHRLLMDSPAHRATMLGAQYTHVGIGVAHRSRDARDLVATLVFARRPRPSAPVTPAMAMAFFASQRRAKGATPLTTDPVLQRAATAGIALLTADPAATPDDALEAAHAALVRESQRLRLSRPSTCVELLQVLELDELAQDPLVLQPRPMKIGLATALLPVGNAVKIFVLVLAEGATCS